MPQRNIQQIHSHLAQLTFESLTRCSYNLWLGEGSARGFPRLSPLRLIFDELKR
jgi:hypothetical protein